MFRNLFGARLPRLALHTLLLALPFAAILAEPALAQNLDPLENMLQVVVDGLTGPIGRLIAILAVVAAGYMMFTGRLNWPLFLAIFFGVVLVFSAATIIDGFGLPPEKWSSLRYGFRAIWRMQECPRRSTSRKRSSRSSGRWMFWCHKAIRLPRPCARSA